MQLKFLFLFFSIFCLEPVFCIIRDQMLSLFVVCHLPSFFFLIPYSIPLYFRSESLFVFNSLSIKLQINSSSAAGTNWSQHTTNKNKFPKERKPHKFARIRFEYLNKHTVLRKINHFFCGDTWKQGLNYGCKCTKRSEKMYFCSNIGLYLEVSFFM